MSTVSGTRLYKIWSGMKARCNNPNVRCYPNYGGRGIKVCEEWQSDFTAFEDWAYSHGYREYLSIDRIDNSKGYNPDNCRWVTDESQANNRRPTRKVIINDEAKTLRELSEQTGIKFSTIQKRYEMGDRGEDLIRPYREKRHQSTPKKITIGGVTKNINQWAKACGLDSSTIRYRYLNGKRGNELIRK